MFPACISWAARIGEARGTGLSPHSRIQGFGLNRWGSHFPLTAGSLRSWSLLLASMVEFLISTSAGRQGGRNQIRSFQTGWQCEMIEVQDQPASFVLCVLTTCPSWELNKHSPLLLMLLLVTVTVTPTSRIISSVPTRNAVRAQTCWNLGSQSFLKTGFRQA